MVFLSFVLFFVCCHFTPNKTQKQTKTGGKPQVIVVYFSVPIQDVEKPVEMWITVAEGVGWEGAVDNPVDNVEMCLEEIQVSLGAFG